MEEWVGPGDDYREAASFDHDSRGNVIEETGPRAGQVTTHEYAGPNSMFRVRTTNPMGHVERWTWDYDCQAPLTSVDVNGQTTSFGYDQLCRPILKTLPSGFEIETFYRTFGNPMAQHVEVSQTSAAASGSKNIDRRYFDGLGRTWKTLRSGETNTSSSDVIVERFGYNHRGGLSWRALPVLGHVSPDPGIPPAAERTTFRYDGQDRLIQTTFGDGRYETNTYDFVAQTLPNGNLVVHRAERSKDPDCHFPSASTKCGEALTILDGRGWVFREVAYDRDSTDLGASGVPRLTTYNWDPLGRLIKVTDPRGSQWAYKYDQFGNRVESDDPDLGIWTMSYDASGNLTRQVDAKAQATTFTYDLLDRQKTKVAGGVTTASTYDQARSGFHNIGQLTTLGNDIETIAYDYSLLGLLAEERHQLDGRTYTFRTSYHSGGLVNALTLPSSPDGSTLASVGTFRYDVANRPSGFGAYVESIGYDARDNPIRLAYANGAVETRSFDPARNWLTEVRTLNGATSLQRTILTRAASGLILRQSTQNSHGRFDYTYDYAGRVLSSINWGDQPDKDQVFTYDAAGSMRSKTGVGAYVYPAATAARPHAPTSVGGAAFAYDANGNMTTGLGGKVMTYDAENRVKTAALGGVTTSYVYGADGTRRKRSVGGSMTLTIGPIEVRTYLASGEVLLRYPTPWFRLHGGSLATFHRDQVGSIQLISDAAGQQGRVTTYQPFGEARDVDVNPLAQPETQGYVGERFDAGPELQFLNARYYDPKLSLFTSPDWLDVTLPGVGTNRYAYAGNSPVNQSDPGGNFPSCIGAAVGALAGLAVQAVRDVIDVSRGGDWSSPGEYAGAAIGGAVAGATFGIATPAGISVAGAFSSGAATVVDSGIRTGASPSYTDLATNMGLGALTAGVLGRFATAPSQKAGAVLEAAEAYSEGAFSLIGANRAIIDPRKITDYALNLSHPKGGIKARGFKSMGFERNNAFSLIEQIRAGVMKNPARIGRVDEYGERFTVDIPVSSLTGRGTVRTGWIYESGSITPRLTTIIPRP